jgi:hypothetical protein
VGADVDEPNVCVLSTPFILQVAANAASMAIERVQVCAVQKVGVILVIMSA